MKIFNRKKKNKRDSDLCRGCFGAANNDCKNCPVFTGKAEDREDRDEK